MWNDLRNRELGDIHPILFSNAIRKRRFCNLTISNYKEIVSPHNGGVNSLRIDLIENRYLLSGASDGSVSTFDTQYTTDYEGGGLIGKHKPLFVIDRHRGGHKYAVSSVSWYPVDTGLFVTGSYDHYVKVWDTNSTKVVVDFKMPGKVYGSSMSSIATTHMLIAAGSSDIQVRLCDIASGAFTHTLTGHRDGIMAVEWSASNEWVVMTGGCDSAIRFWDIRRPGCFRILDRVQSLPGRRPPIYERAINEKGVTIAEDIKNSTKNRRAVLIRDSSGKQLYPRMALSHNLATAHCGWITTLKATEDGMHLISTGADSKICLWDIESGYNLPVCFESTNLQMEKPLQLAVTPDSSLLFVPSMNCIKAFDMWSGKLMKTFPCHYETTNCCCLNSQDQELYTGSNDRHILVFSPFNATIPEVEDGYKRDMLYSSDQDFWSD